MARAIAALYPSDEYVEMIAYHYARTDEDAEAIEWLEKAGDRAAATYANDAAIGHYEAAINRLVRSESEELKLARVQAKLGEVFYQTSRIQEAQEVLDKAIQRFRECMDLQAASRATAVLGSILRAQGEWENARRRLEEMAALLEDSDASAARIQESLAGVFQDQGSYEEMLQAAERAEALLTDTDEKGLRGATRGRRGLALTYLGQIEEGREALEQAIQLLEEAGDLHSLTPAVGNLAFNRSLAGDLDRTLKLDERALELATRTGNALHVLFGRLQICATSLYLGEWEQTREQIKQVQQVKKMRSVPGYIEDGLLVMSAMLALREGRWEEAADLFGSVEKSGSDPGLLHDAQLFLAEMEIRQGRPYEARKRLTAMIEVPGARLLEIQPVLGWACLELGETERGLELAKKTKVQVLVEHSLLNLPDALWIEGMALARLNRIDEARDVLREGRERAKPLLNPYIEAHILVELGLLERQEGNAQASRKHLEEGLATFRRLGAMKDIERVEQELDMSSEP